MTHFTVTVAVQPNPGQDPEKALTALLAPFDENLEVPEYRDYQPGPASEYWAVDWLREERLLHGCDTDLTWEQVAQAWNGTDDGRDRPLLIDPADGRPYHTCTYNQQSKWDYWRVGGRWGGYFPTRDFDAYAACARWAPRRDWDSPQQTGPGRVDGGQKRHLDFAALRQEAADKANAEYDLWEQATGHLPEAKPLSHFQQQIGASYTVEQARTDYRSQPRIQAIKGTDMDRLFGCPIEHYQKPREVAVEVARARAVPGYATLTADGRWMAPGEMGWFGMSSDTESERIGYWEAANAYLESLPDEAYVFVVDCHI